MADPSSLDDLAKVGAGAGGGGVVAGIVTLISKFVTSSRLDALDAKMNGLDVKLQVLIAASEHRDGEADSLRAEQRLSRLEALAEGSGFTVVNAVHNALNGDNAIFTLMPNRTVIRAP